MASDGRRHQRGHGVADLGEGLAHAPGGTKPEAVGEALQARSLAHGDGACLVAIVMDMGVGIVGQVRGDRPAGTIRIELLPAVHEATVIGIRRHDPLAKLLELLLVGVLSLVP